MSLVCLLVALSFGEMDLSEVAGRDLASVISAHQKTYLLYRTSPKAFDLYIYDWQTDKARVLDQDGRVRPVIFAYLVPTNTGLAMVCTANQQVYQLTETGAFANVFEMTEVLEGERAHFVAPGKGDAFYVSSFTESHYFYSLFDLARQRREVLLSIPKEKGMPYFLPFGEQHLNIRYGDGRIEVLDARFQEVSQHPALFERAGMKSSLMGTTQFLRDPIVAGDQLTLTYRAKKGRAWVEASARFQGKQLMFAAFRILAFSPDGTRKMIYDHAADVLRIVPNTFTFPEVRFPPLPEDPWPPETKP